MGLSNSRSTGDPPDSETTAGSQPGAAPQDSRKPGQRPPSATQCRPPEAVQ
nr:MAG TPA: hypothetical protein [Caudoviricetes sp.]